VESVERVVGRGTVAEGDGRDFEGREVEERGAVGGGMETEVGGRDFKGMEVQVIVEVVVEAGGGTGDWAVEGVEEAAFPPAFTWDCCVVSCCMDWGCCMDLGCCMDCCMDCSIDCCVD
jgi:hypothetical protein